MAARHARYQHETIIQIPRLLDRDGRILVRLGDYVASDSVIADTPTAVIHRVIDVGRMLGMSREIPTTDFVDWKVGETIQKDDILAKRGSLFRGVIRSPVSGKIVAVGGGQVMIEIESPRRDIVSGVPGLVRQIVPDRGVILEASGTVAEGLWGNGRMGFGVLHMLANQTLTTLGDVPALMKDKIVVAGAIRDPSILAGLMAAGVKGLICGGLAAALKANLMALPVPVMMVDGFGAPAMNTAAYAVLSNSEKQPCYLLALPRDEHLQQRPLAVVNQKGEAALPATDGPFQPGQKVSVSSRPYLGQTGTIIEIEPDRDIPYAGRTAAALVRLQNDTLVHLPLQNLAVVADKDV